MNASTTSEKLLQCITYVVFQVWTWYWPDAAPVPGNYIIYNPRHEIQSFEWHWDCQNGYS